jgi:hypothetical protein
MKHKQVLFIPGILSQQHWRVNWESLVVLGFGSVWMMSWVGPNYISVGDSKFDFFSLVWFCAHLECFSVVLIGQPGLSHCSLLFLRISGFVFYHYCILFWVIAGHMKVICNCGQQRKTTSSFCIDGCSIGALCVLWTSVCVLILFIQYTPIGLY